MELIVENALRNATEDGMNVFQRVVRHKPRTPEDHAGADFTVDKLVDGNLKCVSFGITISMSSWEKSKKLHTDKPQLFIEYGTSDNRIVQRIQDLFSNSKWAEYVRDVGTVTSTG